MTHMQLGLMVLEVMTEMEIPVDPDCKSKWGRAANGAANAELAFHDVAAELGRRLGVKMQEVNAARPAILTMQQAAAEIGVSLSTVRRMILAGTIPCFRVRKRVLFDREILRQWVASGGCAER